jgi:hypothetical protein
MFTLLYSLIFVSMGSTLTKGAKFDFFCQVSFGFWKEGKMLFPDHGMEEHGYNQAEYAFLIVV